MEMIPAIPSGLSDSELVAAVGALAHRSRETTASLIAHLAELHVRRLHERAGFSSLFTYCREVLRFSEAESYDRMKAAKVASRYPGALALLSSGELSLTAIRLIAPHLKRRSHADLFAAASGKGKREVQEMLARRFPKPDVAMSVRRLPQREKAEVVSGGAAVERPLAELPMPGGNAAMGKSAAVTGRSGETVSSAPSPSTSGPGREPIPAPPRAPVFPLAADRYRVTFTASRDTCDMFELATDLLGHAVPSGDPGAIFARALETLVDELVRRKFAATARPRSSRDGSTDSDYVPAEVRRQVFLRDRGRCAFVSAGGHRCGERRFVEFHHVRPRAMDGPSTPGNIELRCRAHNGYEAAVVFGPMKEHVPAVRTDRRVRDDAFRSGTNVERRGGGGKGPALTTL
jgi:hypothetical protein